MRSPRVPWWPGSIETGGVHVHHLVFGIVTMMVSGVIGYALSDVGFWYEASAVGFGIGIGLTIDEFALWVHLEDVYWEKEGRSSIDATLIAIGIMGLVLVTTTPVDVDTESVDNFILTFGWLILHVIFSLICFAKGRLTHGAIGLIVPFVALYGAVRIGKPGSAWARRFYGARNLRKQEKAEHRFPPDRRTERIKERIRDAVGGSTSEEYQAKLAARRAAAPPE